MKVLTEDLAKPINANMTYPVGCSVIVVLCYFTICLVQRLCSANSVMGTTEIK